MEKYTKGQLFLARNANKLDADTQRLMSDKSIRYTDGDFYIRREVTGSANIEKLIDETNEKRVGVTNIDKNTLPNQQHLALERIAVRYAEAATGTSVQAVDSFSSVKTGVPAALLNAELKIMQDNKTLVQLPVARFFSESASEKPNGVEDTVVLNSIQLVKANKGLSIEIEYADGQSVTPGAGNDAYLEVRLMGDKTTTK
jgi:hypothetical protein